MQTSTFLTRFQLLALPENQSPQPKQLKASAVLIALFEEHGELQVILTQRAAHLTHHAGQISFVGGKVDQQDRSVIETALREAEEEIALPREQVQVLGQLTPINTRTGFLIYPIVGLITQPFIPKIDQGEVAEVFQVPLSFLLDQRHWFEQQLQRRGKRFTLHFIPWQGKLIWGATAAILNQLCEQLCGQISLDH